MIENKRIITEAFKLEEENCKTQIIPDQLPSVSIEEIAEAMGYLCKVDPHFELDGPALREAFKHFTYFSW